MAGKGKTPKLSGFKYYRRSRSSKAGLVFPVGRIARYWKAGKYSKRLGASTPVYTAAVLEYLTAEVLELAGIEAKEKEETKITPRHIQLGVRKDGELAKLFRGTTIANSGVVPNIQLFLHPNRTKNYIAVDDENCFIRL